MPMLLLLLPSLLLLPQLLLLVAQRRLEEAAQLVGVVGPDGLAAPQARAHRVRQLQQRARVPVEVGRLVRGLVRGGLIRGGGGGGVFQGLFAV
ncbi:hypothetical protein GGR56DRAFT_626220 [Xylariaceae sp. FL0804]|nr:hypothetical protein GGR56DRAFT_626220 [Xylariaceae sp. FL0804]